MNGILPPAVELAAKQARSQAIAEYFESGGSADDTSAEGITGQIPLLHLVLSASPRDGVRPGLIGDRLEEAVRAVLDGGPRTVRAAGGTWTRYIHEPRVRLDGLRQLCCQGRATPQTYFFLGLPWTHMRARRRNQNFLARVFTALPADVFRHAIGFWRSDRDDYCRYKVM